MRSQNVHTMLRKPKHSAQTPLAAAAWETYLREHFHARIKSCQTPPHEAAARSEGSCPESTHAMEVRPPTEPVGNPPAGPLMDAVSPNILITRVADLPAQSARVAALTARPMGIDTQIATQTERPESSHKGVWGRIRQGVESLAGTVRSAAQHMRTRRAEPPGSSARDLAISVSRNNPPPAVQFRQMAQSGWVPEPDVFEMPDADKLQAMTCDHITRMNIKASPGFDIISAPFIKHTVRWCGWKVLGSPSMSLC